MDQGYRRGGWYDQSLPAAPAEPPKKKKRRGLRTAAIVLCALIVVVAGVLAGLPRVLDLVRSGPALPDATPAPTAPGASRFDDFRDFLQDYYADASVQEDTPSALPRTEAVGDFTLTLYSSQNRSELSLQSLYAKCVGSIVGIRATVDGDTGYYWGTGIVLSADGYIVTNQHIIAGTDAATVICSDGAEYPALLVGEDVQTDIAVLKIAARGLRPATFGDSGELVPGDPVAAIGNPLADTFSGTLTNGIISALDRSVTHNGHTISLLQTTAALNEGNSGGALFNMYGQVIGITNMKMSSGYSDLTIESMGFAIPSTTVKLVADRLIAQGEFIRPGIGITVGPIPAEARARYPDLPEGLYISAVSQSSDAWAQGIRRGDVLTMVDGTAVTSNDQVLALRDTHTVGDTMTLTIYRAGETLEVVITLGTLSQLY